MLLAVTTVILTFIAGGSRDGNSFDLQLSVLGRGVRERYGQAMEHGRSSKVAWTLGSPIFSPKAFCRVEQNGTEDLPSSSWLRGLWGS